MRPSLTIFIAFLALIFHLPVFAQTPPKDDAPAKVRIALLPGAPALDPATQGALVQWLTRFQDNVYRMRIREYLEMVDWDVLIDETLAGLPDKPDAARKLRLKNLLMVQFERTFPIIRNFFSFNDAEVRRVDVTDGKAVIIARIHDEDGGENKVRWWLQRHDNQWQMTDFENITFNMRLSAVMNMGIQAGLSKEGLNMEHSVKFTQMGIAVQDGDFEKAYAIIKELEGVKMPAMLTEVFLGAKTGVLSQLEGKEAELEAALNEFEKTAPASPVLLMMRASSCYDAEDYKNTIVWADKLGAAVGHDEDSWSMLADSHRELKQDKEYLAAAEGWAADYPNSPTALLTLWQALPESKRAEKVKPLLDQITPAEDGLTEFAEGAYMDDDTAALKLVLEVMQARKLPKETLDDYQTMLQETLDSQKDAAKEKKK
ncbi:tetratricopeptide repeat protein [Prosthecobacter sp.]|uniref:tetratricopeptide repeat protein n=1 Tax=Prosthecobacter sp. TaxID=1965333 RepID=UPI003785095E